MSYFNDINLSSKRGEHETYEEYKARRKKNNASVKMHLKGFLKDDNKTKLTKKK